MTAIKTRTFQSGNSQAVRLPKGLAYPMNTELLAERDGDVVTLRPVATAQGTGADLAAALLGLQVPTSKLGRDTEGLAERAGL
ncbi:MAG: hypothetical protein MUF14_01750 [Hyphomonadaceae bacterium]|jgi:antitoxin VapB|nr:hypothetical protein [Hyphomonadaceae bacterium]